MKRKLGVIGAGSAGLLTLVHFTTWLDNSWEVYSIHNPAKKILGIGESTNGEFVGLLERGTHFCMHRDLHELDATLKFGSKFTNWREHSWLNPLLDGNIAIHFNNFKLKDFVYKRLAQIWPKQFRLLEGDVKELKNCPHKVAVVMDDGVHDFDYVIDCMGFPTDYEGYAYSDCSPVNRCLIHSVPGETPDRYTDHIATPHGWMFGVPLMNRKTYGYMFNDKITPKEEAQKDMMRILEVPELATQEKEQKEYIFRCYYAKKMIEGRIAKNGNKALFFEPLIANSIFQYIHACRLFYDHIINGMPKDDCNRAFVQSVNEMEDVISYYYQGGTIFDSEFWRYAKQSSKERLSRRPEFDQMMETYRNFKANGVLHQARTYGFSPLTWELVDAQMGYGYLAEPQAEVV